MKANLSTPELVARIVRACGDESWGNWRLARRLHVPDWRVDYWKAGGGPFDKRALRRLEAALAEIEASPPIYAGSLR